ncbi:solute carrier family 66 member 3-like [Centroberyx gerrardi]|uniref:solute carrier family 66 member 3-like n=1 Tax=Centroberyx gerrardi TaxID=166262 RepID=UPI003AAB4FE6
MEVHGALLNIATYSTFLICLVLKLPQILILTKAKSSKGLSLTGLLLELAGYIVFVTYQWHHNHPISTYIEYPALILQDTILLILLLNYSGSLRQSLAYSVLFVCGWQLLTVQGWIIDMVMSVSTFISASSKFVQLQSLWQSQDSSQVSALSWGMSTYTCLARTFTTLMTTDDKQVLLRICVLTSLNSWVLATIFHYRRGSKKQD